MPGNSLSAPPRGGHRFAPLLRGLILLLLPAIGASSASGADGPGHARFLGNNTCSTSYCHGGASPENGNNAHTDWMRKDAHGRAYLTLQNARARQIAAAAGLASATDAAACTVCHAPMADVPAGLIIGPVDVTLGLSCESCHGPAEDWLRFHTRPDVSHADRVQAGLRKISTAYARANQCVACHQAVPSELLRAGHPELIFELDGQIAAQPRHWNAERDPHNVVSWLAGQAVALRELAWQLEREADPDPRVREQFDGLLWLLNAVSQNHPTLRPFAGSPENAPAVKEWADQFARTVSATPPNKAGSLARLQALKILAEKLPVDAGRRQNGRRAERLVLGLDRVFQAAPDRQRSPVADAQIAALFELVQSLPDFDRDAFVESAAKLSPDP